ncbi:MAG TPA: alpha/beta hydrolase [Dehalococcoidia bacterium]|nr:alpha/beta hydrolase [Dehalococcoidia bacterium]
MPAYPNDGFSHHQAQVNGLRYHYVRQGSGPPLVLVHGWPGFYYEWHLNIGPLSERFDVVAPDMRGYGYTDKPDVPPAEGYTSAHFAQDLAALLDHLGWQRASFVAHDFGAIWVQRFARTYPQRVERLVLFDPPYPGIGPRWFEPSRLGEVWYMFFHQLPLAEELVGSSRRAIEAYLRHFLSHWSYQKELWTDEEIGHYVEAFSQPGALRGGFNCYRATFQAEAGQWASPQTKIEAPTLVLWAEADPILPVAWSDRLGDYFSRLTLKRVPQAGHFLMRERPELVNAEVTAFVLGGGSEG